MHFTGRLSAPSRKVLPSSPLFLPLEKVGVALAAPENLSPLRAGPGVPSQLLRSCWGEARCVPALAALGAAASLLGCRRAGRGERDRPWGSGHCFKLGQSPLPQQPARLSSSFVPELIYFLSTSDVCYLDF